MVPENAACSNSLFDPVSYFVVDFHPHYRNYAKVDKANDHCCTIAYYSVRLCNNL